MKDIVVDANWVSACGMYCGACPKWRRGECPGCRGNKSAIYCRVRRCVRRRGIRSCADCDTYTDLRRCTKVNGLLFRTVNRLVDVGRIECLERIRALGHAEYAATMAREGRQNLPRGWKGDSED